MVNVSIAVFDDADIVASPFVLKHLVDPLPSDSKTIFISSNRLSQSVKSALKSVSHKRLVSANGIMPSNIDNFYVKCVTISKYAVIQKIITEAYKENAIGKIIVFFSVSILHGYVTPLLDTQKTIFIIFRKL